MNTVELDTAYKAFLKVRQEWISTLNDFTQYPEPDTTPSHAVARPVAVIGGEKSGGTKTLERLKHLQSEWQRFHDMAEAYRENKISPIPKSMYHPVPFVAPECEFAVVNVNPGANTVKWYVEKVVSLIKKHINMATRELKSAAPGQAEALEDRLLLLEADLARFQKIPEGTKLVRRQDGYVDITVSLKDEATLDEVNTVAAIFDGFIERDLIRVGQYGCVIQEPGLKYKLAIYDRSAGKGEAIRNIYDRVKPIPCSVMANNVSLFLAEAVEEAKQRVKQESQDNKRDTRRIYAARSYSNLRAKQGKAVSDDHASKTAVPVSRRTKLSKLAEPMKK